MFGYSEHDDEMEEKMARRKYGKHRMMERERYEMIRFMRSVQKPKKIEMPHEEPEMVEELKEEPTQDWSGNYNAGPAISKRLAKSMNSMLTILAYFE